jgi:uncharacterized protein YndB with AHSA1/START domain
MLNTVRLHRIVATRPEKIYRAFIEPDAMAKWLPPNGFTCTVHHMDPKAGGSYRMSFPEFHHRPGSHVQWRVRGARSQRAFALYRQVREPGLAGEIQVTVTLKKVSLGTEVDIVQQGLPEAIPIEACYLGWQESLRNLAKLVEPEITN